MSAYEPREYWTRVAEEIGRRPGPNVIAGLDTPFYEFKRKKFLREFLHSIPASGATIVEIGCGPGGNLIELAKAKPLRLVGCDISPGMLELARSNTADAANVECFEIDGARLPFADREFRFAFTATVLQHNLDDAKLDALLGEICRVTDETVYLFEDSAKRRTQRATAVLRPVEDYARVCRANGFDLVEAEVLRVYASERTAGALRRVLNRRPLQAGEEISALNATVERAALPLTRLVDAVGPQPRGLTKMVFARSR
ncbi:MAG TPA: class I SAM-dependent methyltransferase [Gaiellaceae bacterium]|nr:class I SAM-dependent methyltransferase [Gaiellaceae bacterium]